MRGSKSNRGDIRGNFALGTWFGDVKCTHGHPVRLLNIQRNHIVACDICRAFIHVGSNLMSSWRQENRDVWEENWLSIAGYREVARAAPAQQTRQ